MKRFHWVSLLFLVLLLGACGGAYAAATSPVGPIDTPTPGSHPTTTPSIAASRKFQEFALPQDNSGLMRPAIDHEGRIWFGEMARNYLAVFDPRTGAFQQMTPPRGLSGIMGVEVAADDTIWYAEQYADYIGHYFPATGRYQLYQLPNVTVPDPSNPGKTLTIPSAPNDLAFDAHGNVWFTQLNANALGRLDPSSGSIWQYALSTSQNARPLNTYGITVDPRGAVWFTEASTGHIGRLDPATGAIRYFGPPGMAATFMEIASDARGTIWATSFDTGLLVSLNPGTGVFTRYYAPSPDGNAGGLYGLTTTPTGEVWVTVSAIGIIARLDTTANRFVYYTIPTGGSMPLGIVLGPHHTLWFTEAGSDKIGMLQP